MGDVATRLGQAVTGIAAYTGAYQDALENSYKDNISKLSEDGKRLYEKTQNYLQKAKDALSQMDTPQAKKLAQETETIYKNLATAKARVTMETYAAMAESTHKATEAARNAKVATVAGSVGTLADMTAKANAGDWEGFGQSSAGLLGATVGAELAVIAITVVLAFAGVTIGVPAMVGIATLAAIGAVAGETIGKKAWDNTKEMREAIPDVADHIAGELARWLGLNRDGKHYFVDPLVLDLDGDGIETVGHNKK